MATGADFKPGELLDGRFEILSVLGVGSMGTVYKVHDTHLNDTVVALKLLSPDFGVRPDELRRFQREVLLLRKLSHPNIVHIHDFGTTLHGRHFYTMEFVDGESLYSLLYSQYDTQLHADQLLSILLDIGEGLCAAHRNGIVHCDLKPENIMLCPDGRAKIADFGLSSDLHNSKHTHAKGMAVGTPFYMSPEQFRGDGIDHRADIYALGLIAYEMACRKKPFQSSDYFELAEQHFYQRMPDVRADRDDLPRWYAELIERCTEKQRECRLQSAEEVLQFLRKHIGHRKEFKRRRAGRKTTFFDALSLRQQLNGDSESQAVSPSTEVRMQQSSGMHILADAHYLLGSEYLAQSKLDAARQHLELSSQLDPYNFEALFARAALAERMGEFELAVSLYRKALRKDSHLESAYLALGMLYYRLGRNSEALLHLGTFVGIARGQTETEESVAEAETIVRRLEANWAA